MKDIVASDDEQEVEDLDYAFQLVEEWTKELEDGYAVWLGGSYYALKRWDVKLRNNSCSIRISNADYERLCKMVKKN